MIQQISTHVYRIPLGAVNAYVIKDGEELTLVDTGYAKQVNKIFRALAKIGHAPEDLKRIILTHSHPDHAGSLAALVNLLNIPTLAHPADAQLIRQGIAARLPFLVSKGILNWLIFRLFIKNADNKIEPCRITEELEDGRLLPIAGGLEVIHTPGHSSGHISLLVRNDHTLIAGDLCANIGGLALATVNEDPQLAKASILKTCQKEFEIAVFGHGKPIMKKASRVMGRVFS